MSLTEELQDAAERGDLEDIRRLVQDEGVDVNTRLKNDKTVLHWAVGHTDSDIAQFLLEHTDVNVNARDRRGMTPLHSVCVNRCLRHRHRHDETVLKLLLNHKGVDINAPDKSGQTALFRVLQFAADKRVVQLLLHHKANITATSNTGKTALHCALYYGADFDVVELLLNHGASTNARAAMGKTPLHTITPSRGISAQVMELLLLHGNATAAISTKDAVSQTPLHILVKCNCTDAVAVLLRRSSHIESVLLSDDCKNKRLPFHNVRSLEMAQVLLEQQDSAHVCHDMLLAKDGDGKTLVELLDGEGVLHDYIVSYTDVSLTVPRDGGVAVRINPLFNEFQTHMAESFLRKDWLSLFDQDPSDPFEDDLQQQHDEDDNLRQDVLPVELKFVVMSYLSLADIMKAQE